MGAIESVKPIAEEGKARVRLDGAPSGSEQRLAKPKGE